MVRGSTLTSRKVVGSCTARYARADRFAQGGLKCLRGALHNRVSDAVFFQSDLSSPAKNVGAVKQHVGSAAAPCKIHTIVKMVFIKVVKYMQSAYVCEASRGSATGACKIHAKR